MAIKFLNNIDVIGSVTSSSDLTLSGLSAQNSEATALVINGSGVVGTRELGSNAFNSTSFLATSGKAADSNLLDGLDLHTGRNNVANRVVRTQGNGYIEAGWINTTSGNTTNTITDVYVNTNDGYIRKATAAEFKSQLGILSTQVTSGTQTIAGAKTFSSGIVTPSVRATGGNDGGFCLRQWTHSSGYASLATNGMSGLEYCVISDGTNTFIGSGTNGTTRLRGPANDSSPQLEMTSTLCKIDSGDLKVEDGSIAVGTITNSTTNGRIDASNDIVAFSTSDIRLKDNIKSIDKALDKVNSIQGIEFDWIEKEEVHGNSGHDIGVIAQEVEKILPDVVTTRDNGYKAVKYEKIVPLLIEAIKDLSKQVDGLKRLI